MLPDYADYESAIGLDWYAVDPNLRLLLDRHLLDPGDRAFAEEHVAALRDAVRRRRWPERAEVTDKHGPVLARYDRWGYEVDDDRAPLDVAREQGRPRAGRVHRPPERTPDGRSRRS